MGGARSIIIEGGTGSEICSRYNLDGVHINGSLIFPGVKVQEFHEDDSLLAMEVFRNRNDNTPACGGLNESIVDDGGRNIGAGRAEVDSNARELVVRNSGKNREQETGGLLGKGDRSGLCGACFQPEPVAPYRGSTSKGFRGDDSQNRGGGGLIRAIIPAGEES
jgi:hypothetical protein